MSFYEKITFKISTILLVLLCISCSENDNSKSWSIEKDIIENEGAIKINHDGGEREYLIYVPIAYSDDSASVPLFFNFHGGGGTAAGQMYISDMRSMADIHNVILIYPQGSSLSNGSSHWNSSFEAENSKSSTNDFDFISTIINKVSSNYNINQNRIYACGFSNGGDFSISLACYLSDKITAIASVSGLMSSESIDNCNPLHKTGVMIFNGTADFARPYGGIPDYYLSVHDAIGYWTEFNEIDSSSVMNINDQNGNIIEHTSYFKDLDRLLIENYKIIDGGHDWFDINYQSKDIDQIIFDFFLTYEIQ